MKGQASVTEIIITLTLAIVTIVVIIQLPTIVEDFANLLALGSAEIVSRDLGNLITVAGAGIEKTTINYEPLAETFTYTAKISNRIVNLDLFVGRPVGGLEVGPGIEVGKSKTAVGEIEKQLENVREFIITKDDNLYNIEGS